jgi:hypothetical protein
MLNDSTPNREVQVRNDWYLGTRHWSKTPVE